MLLSKLNLKNILSIFLSTLWRECKISSTQDQTESRSMQKMQSGLEIDVDASITCFSSILSGSLRPKLSPPSSNPILISCYFFTCPFDFLILSSIGVAPIFAQTVLFLILSLSVRAHIQLNILISAPINLV